MKGPIIAYCTRVRKAKAGGWLIASAAITNLCHLARSTGGPFVLTGGQKSLYGACMAAEISRRDLWESK